MDIAIAQEFINVKTIDEDFIQRVINTYGKQRINQFLENHSTIFSIQSKLSKKDRITILKKIRQFVHLYGTRINPINYDGLLAVSAHTKSHQKGKKENESSPHEKYFQKVKNYSLLTPLEEIQVGWDLLLKDKIYIMSDRQLKMLNMGTVLLSISSEKQRKQVFDILEQFYQGADFIDSDEAKIVKQDMHTYNRICRKLGRIPTSQELGVYFNTNQTSNKIYFDDDSRELPFNELMDQLQKFIIYRKARMTMFNCNLRLVIKIVNQYANSNNIDDLMAEGNYALLKSIDHYDVNYGTKFSTYATGWITQYILNYIQHDRNPRIPDNKITKINQLRRKIKGLEESQQKTSTADISELTGIPLDEMMNLLIYSQPSVSLDAPLLEGENITLLDTLVGDTDATSLVEKESQKQEAKKLLGYLSPRYQEIMLKRFGFNTENGEPMTLAAIGKEYGVTKERIRQIENTSLKKLRFIMGISSEEQDVELHRLK